MTRVVQLASLVVLALVLAGCGSPVNQANFDQVKDGMSVAEVEAVLGKPTESGSAAGALGGLAGSVQQSTWKDGEKSITVTYANGKVKAKIAKGL